MENLNLPSLTAEDRQRVWDAIGRAMEPDDEEPQTVIQDKFGGNEDWYLVVMAHWHHVPIGGQLLTMRPPTPEAYHSLQPTEVAIAH